jgi:hypothetical protein
MASLFNNFLNYQNWCIQYYGVIPRRKKYVGTYRRLHAKIANNCFTSLLFFKL